MMGLVHSFKAFIPVKFAVRILAGLFAMLIAYHVLILLGLIPYELVWGGRLKSHQDMVRFETISLVLNIGILMVVLNKMGWPKTGIRMRNIHWFFWAFFVLFLINTLGNAWAINAIERFVFTPLTFILSVLCLRVALDRSSDRG